jgi:type VI secretion system protein ImpK
MQGALTTGSAVRSAPQEFADSGLAARIALRMRQAIASWNPWATGMLAALILLAAYAALSFRLGAAVDHVETNLQGLALAAPAASSAAAAKVPDLASALAGEVSAGLLTVIDEPGRTTVRIASDALFGTGSNTVEERFMPILGRLSQALSALPGAVLVTGHTDSSELSVSSRFRSKFELSDERARAVAEVLLRGGVADDRLRSEGRSDGEPAAPNDTPAGRARNRRVEVTLFQPFTPSRPAAPKGGS